MFRLYAQVSDSATDHAFPGSGVLTAADAQYPPPCSTLTVLNKGLINKKRKQTLRSNSLNIYSRPHIEKQWKFVTKT